MNRNIFIYPRLKSRIQNYGDKNSDSVANKVTYTITLLAIIVQVKTCCFKQDDSCLKVIDITKFSKLS